MGKAESFSETSAEMLCSATSGHAPAFQQWHQQHAGRREVEDVLRSTVSRAPHLHDLQGAEEIAATLEVPGHDHAVREGLLDPPAGNSLPRSNGSPTRGARCTPSRSGRSRG